MSKLPIEMCTGCTACASICPQNCIVMLPDDEGFSYPTTVLEDCVNCGLCAKVCPLINDIQKGKVEPKAYAAYSKDENIRLESSSGGIFSEIAKNVLKCGGSVYGAAYNETFEVVHSCVKKEADLFKLRGAKYAQSDLGSSFKEIKGKLDGNQLVLFSGTPCQVVGLKAFLCKTYENLITIDFICHSIPSPMAWREYVKYRSIDDNEGIFPVEINLRSKETGWSNYKYSNKFEYCNGITHICKSGDSLYMKLFIEGFISRRSCGCCPFKGYNRSSDLTIGDFWGIWDVAPEMDDNKGTSVTFVHSDKGRSVWETVSSKIKYKEVTLEQASQQNPYMLVPFRDNPNRAIALREIRDGRINHCAELFAAPKTSLLSLLKNYACKLIKRD